MRDNQLSTPQLVSPIDPINAGHSTSLCSPLFSGISERDCACIASAAVWRTFARGETLFTQGKEVRNLILLRSGNVKHTQLSPHGDEALLRISSAGDIVCVQGLSSIRCHTCSGRATEECHALVWEHDQMQKYLALYPRLGINMTRILAAQLSDLEERFREVATERLNRRLALLLLRLSKQMGKPSHNGTQILLRREEIAQMAGATVFSISRMLARWSEKGVILTAREAVIVRDPKRLELMDEPTVETNTQIGGSSSLFSKPPGRTGIKHGKAHGRVGRQTTRRVISRGEKNVNLHAQARSSQVVFQVKDGVATNRP